MSFKLVDMKEEIINEFNKRVELDYTPFATGFDNLDNILGGGFDPSQVHLIAAQPGTGKTTMLINIALNNLKKNRPVIFITAELSKIDFISRVVNIMTVNTNWKSIKDGQNNSLVKDKLNELSNYNFYILGSEDVNNASNLEELMVKVVNEVIDDCGKVPLLCLDYLQLLAVRDTSIKSTDYRAKVDKISTGLVTLANSTGCCVLVISSTARSNYTRGGDDEIKRTNVLSMGKESGQLEFDAATVSGMFQGKKYTLDDEDFSRVLVEFKIAKNRFYESGMSVELSFIGKTGRFEELGIRDYQKRLNGFRDIVNSGEYKTQSQIAVATMLSVGKVNGLLKELGCEKNEEGFYRVKGL